MRIDPPCQLIEFQAEGVTFSDQLKNVGVNTSNWQNYWMLPTVHTSKCIGSFCYQKCPIPFPLVVHLVKKSGYYPYRLIPYDLHRTQAGSPYWETFYATNFARVPHSRLNRFHHFDLSNAWSACSGEAPKSQSSVSSHRCFGWFWSFPNDNQ